MDFNPTRSNGETTQNEEQIHKRDKSILFQTATYLLFIVLVCFGLLLPASGWNLPSAKKFTLEIAEDTISYLFIMTAPPIAIISLILANVDCEKTPSQHILACAGIVNFSIPLAYYVLELGLTYDCMIAMLRDTFSETIASLWMSEIARVYAVFVFLVIFELNRCQMAWWKALLLLGLPTEIGLPIFLSALKENESKKAKAANANALMSYSAVFVTNILTWMWFLYRWAEEEGSGRFDNLVDGLTSHWQGIRVLFGIAIIVTSICVYVLPDIKVRHSKFPNILVTWMLRLLFAAWLLGNTGAIFAYFLVLREQMNACRISKERDMRPITVQFCEGLKDLGCKKQLNSYWFLFVVSSVITFVSAPFHHLFFTFAFMCGFTLISHCLIPDFDLKIVVEKIVFSSKIVATFYFIGSFIMAIVIWDVASVLARALLTRGDAILIVLLLVVLIIASLLWGAFIVYRSNLFSWRTMSRVLPFAAVLFFGLFAINKLSDPSPCHLKLNTEYFTTPSPHIGGKVCSTLESGPIPAPRLHHHQGHGCVAAQFEIDPSVPYQFRKGIFSQPGKKYDALIRFSSSSRKHQEDNTYDTLGLALKIFDVEGQRLLNDSEAIQDFVLSSSPTFFVDDLDDDHDLLDALHQGNALGLLRWTIDSLTDPWRFKSVFKLIASWIKSQKVDNPLHTKYYSNTPYRLGSDLAVKWAIKPCWDTNHREVIVDRKSGYYLQESMEKELSQDNACFDFFVQRQTNACEHPIDDPTIIWRVPFSHLATIHIPKQSFSSFQQHRVFCNNIGFNPWSGIEDHKPLGKINLHRKEAYLSGFKTRSIINKADVNALTFTHFNQIPNGPSWIGGDTWHYKYKQSPSPFQHIPKHISELNPNDDFSDTTKFGFYLAVGPIYLGAGITELRCSLKFGVNCLGTFEDFKRLTNSPMENRWREDEEFARQFLTGINPMQIYSVAKRGLPSAFNTSKEAMGIYNEFLSKRGEKSFRELQLSSRLFIADYEILSDIESKDDRIFYSSIVLLYVSKHEKLFPLAIQLTRNSNHSNQIYTPDDNEEVWLFARMHATLSDSLVHEMVHHLCYTHLIMEPMLIAFHRQLHSDHAIMKLMKPHFRSTLAINTFGRSTLLRPDDAFDRIAATGLVGSLQLIQKSFQNYHFMNKSFPADLESRGLDQDILPGYYFRQDGYKIWNAISNYVSNVIELQYLGNVTNPDEFVKNDWTIQNLYYELTHEGLAGAKGIPKLDSKVILIEFLTNMIWTCTAQHSAVNFGQEEYYSYIPNRPFLLSRAMPNDRSRVSMEYIFASLPDAEQSLKSIQVAKFLSTPSELPINKLMNGHPFPKEYQAFLNELEEITEEINKRNEVLVEKGEVPYVWLRPDKIASSIAI